MTKPLRPLALLCLLVMASGAGFAAEAEQTPEEEMRAALQDLRSSPMNRSRLMAKILGLMDKNPEKQQDLAAIFVKDMLKSLKEYPSDRGMIRKDLLDSLARRDYVKAILFQEAKALTALESGEKDKNYIANLVIILSEIGDRDGVTDTLLQLLDSTSFQIRYLSEAALGKFWADEGKKAEPSEKCKEVSTALVGLLSTDISPPEVYAVGRALYQINEIPKPTAPNPYTKKEEPVDLENVPVAEARKYLETWSQGAGGRLLLPPEKRKPLHIYSTYRKSSREDLRLQARKVLIEQKPLDVVDAILNDLRTDQKLSDVERDDLATILTEITSVPLSLRQARSRGDVILALREWRGKFEDFLAVTKDERVRRYVIARLTDAIRLQKLGQGSPQDISNWQWICIDNFDKMADLPRNVSDEVVTLLRPFLVRKEELAKALGVIRTSDQLGDKLLNVTLIQTRLLLTPDDKRLAWLFVKDIMAVACELPSRRVVTGLRELLRDITGYPPPTIEDFPLSDRKKLLDDWYNQIPKGERGLLVQP